MKFLKSLSKFFVITTGTISLVTLMGIGIAGNVYKQDVIEAYNSVHNTMVDENNKDIFTNVNTELDKLNGTVDKTVDDIKNQINSSKTELTKLDDFIKKLEEQASNGGSTKAVALFNNKAGTDDIQQTIKQLRDTYNKTNEVLTNAETLVNTEGENVKKLFDEGGFVYELKGTMNTAQGYFDKLTNFFTENPPDKFEQYYSTTVDTLTIAPAVILGIGIIGSILTFLFYKSVDGKMVRRSSAEKDLTNHVKYLIKKYPNIKDKIID